MASPSTPPASLRIAVAPEADADAAARRQRTWPMLLADLTTMSADLVGELRGLSAAEGAVQSLCRGWTVRDVVVHFMVGDHHAIRALNGEDCFPDASTDETVLDRQNLEWVRARGDIDLEQAVEAFATLRHELLEVLDRVAVEDQFGTVPWGALPISRFALTQSRLMETWVHGWDLRWPLERLQPFDDRCWWIADMAVRTVPYALRQRALRADVAEFDIELDGVGGGHWRRPLDRSRDGSVEIRGPAWAWVAWASRRDPATAARAALIASSSARDAGEHIIETARAFA